MAPSGEGVRNRCSPQRLLKIIKRLNESQKLAVREIGLGSLLDMTIKHCYKGNIVSLLASFDPEKCCLEVSGRTFEISPPDVQRILGVTSAGESIEIDEVENDLTELKKMYCDDKGKIPLGELERRLQEKETADEDFLRLFVLLALGSFLCPQAKPEASTKFLNLIMDMEGLRTLNWSKLVLDWLIAAIRRYKEKHQIYVGGCLVFLKVNYCYTHISYIWYA